MLYFKRCFALFSVCFILAASFSGCEGRKTADKQALIPAKNENDDNWQTVTDETAVLENDNISFRLDASNTHFSVYDKRSGVTYTSVPETAVPAALEEDAYRIASEITVRYYGEQTAEQFMYSETDSVQNKKFTVKTNGEKIRVYYTLGKASDFVPQVFDEKEFASVLERLGSAAVQRRFERYYNYYGKDDRPSDYKEKLNEYPVLAEKGLYIIDGMLSDVEKEGINEYLAEISYTENEYQDMLKRINTEIKTNDGAPGFVIPVEYSISSDGFSAAVLSDKIVESSKEYRLQSVDFLEYFAAFDNSAIGNYVVPDGSGALIAFNSDRGEFSAPYYGKDYTVRSEKQEALEKQLSLPVFGIDAGKGGILGIIENGSEIAELTVSPYSDSSPLNHAWVTFNYLSIDVTDYGAGVNIPIYNLFSGERCAVTPRIRYVLLENGGSDYISMAGILRNYMNENGVLTNNSSEAPVYIDYLCMITKSASMMGVPYSKKIVLSTLDEIIASVSKLVQADIGPCVVRLFGYSPSGLENKAYSVFEIDSRVGTAKQLAELNVLLEKSGGRLYLDADIEFAYKKGNGFSPSSDAARYLNRLLVYRGAYDIVTRDYSADKLAKYFISPLNYEKYSKSFSVSLEKKLGKSSLPGLSYGNFGLYLGGDYAKNNDIDRCESSLLIQKALEERKKDGYNISVDNGNAYTLKYASDILNVPAGSSELECETADIPFFQAVVQGSIPYSGAPCNLFSENGTQLSRSAEFGASPYAAFITKEDLLITNTAYESVWYSLSENNRLDKFISKAKAEYELRKAVSGAYIAGIEENNELFEIQYSNGKTVYVNRGVSNAAAGEISLKPGEFLITEDK